MYSQLQLCGASLEGRHLNSFFYFIGSNFSAKKMSVGYICMCVCVRCLDFNLKEVYGIAEVPLLMRLLSGSCDLCGWGTGMEDERDSLHTHVYSLPFCPPRPFLCGTLHAGLTLKVVHPSILPLPFILCVQIPPRGCSPVRRFFLWNPVLSVPMS